MPKEYQIHIEQVSVTGSPYIFNSDPMTLVDVMQLREKFPHSVVTKLGVEVPFKTVRR